MKRNRQSSRRNSAGFSKSFLLTLCLAALVAAGGVWLFARGGSASADPVEIKGDMLTVTTKRDIPRRLIHYKGMDVSFNPELHIPNWVAWELTAKEAAGNEPRSDNFAPDTNVPGCPDLADYKYSGYQRGHMAPAGDMKWNREAMAQSFYLTNICPQAPKLNTGSWKSLEEKCRTWATLDSAIYIVCGPVPEEPLEYIGANRVAVPRRFFKVIVSPYSNPPRGIAFVMPNGVVPGGMQKCAMSIDAVESLTGYDFFSALPDSIETAVEAQCDFNRWSRMAVKR